MMETRKQRRLGKVNVKGKQINVLKFLSERAKALPRIIDRETGMNFDHAAILKKIYLQKGRDGVDGYVARAHAVAMRDTGKNWRIRLLGRILIMYYKIFRNGK